MMNIQDGIATEIEFSECLFVGFEILVIFIVDNLKNIPRSFTSFYVEKWFLTNFDNLLEFFNLALYIGIIWDL